MDVLLAGYALAVPLLARRIGGAGAGAEGVFMVLVFAAGFLTGAEFPIGSRIYMDYASHLGRTAALVDGCDHLGACAGSMLVGVVAIPLLGLETTCVIVALMKACTAALMMMTRE
jgi:predicted membrane-bound spermidine synthase